VSSAQPVLVAFASGTEDLIPDFLRSFKTVAPGLPLYVVAEFAPPEGHWIPWKLGRTYGENRARILAALEGKQVLCTALLSQPRQPYWTMRRMAVSLGRKRTLVYNENFDHLRLHPSSAFAVLRHLLWRAGNLIRWETRPGGFVYTQVWRLLHPSSLVRPVIYRLALRAGARAAQMKSRLTRQPPAPSGSPLPQGVSVVIPSRNGKPLLESMLPGLIADLSNQPHEVIVVDNGSADGTVEWLAAAQPSILTCHESGPLSFASAVNRGIARARYSHLCLLNNDMEVRPGFIQALLDAFGKVPDLFCSTAQIFFPGDKRREETGKAVLSSGGEPQDFQIRCETPLPGEDMTYVTYGSGGCSLYDTAKLRAIGGFGEAFKPAYVEDLDAGWRGWARGWPTVFSARATVLHHHRATTSRYFTEDQIRSAVERNYLLFLARSVSDPGLFTELWNRAVLRVNWHAAREPQPAWAMPVLKSALEVERHIGLPPAGLASERLAMHLAGGETFSFPGRQDQSSGRRVVIVASPYMPFPLAHGGAVRMYNLMRRAARDFDHVLVSFCDQPSTPSPEILEICREVVLVRRTGTHLLPLTGRPEVVEEHDSLPFRAALREMIRKHSAALVQLEFTQMGLYAPDCAPVPSILVEHDITIDLYAKLLARQPDWETQAQLERWRSFEREAWRTVDCVVAMSEKDRSMVGGAKMVETLANGVDLERFRPAGVEPEPKRILFIGSFAHLPNIMALRYFLDQAWPALHRAGATLHVIAGSNPGHYLNIYRDRVSVDTGQPGIEMEAFVADVRPAYARAAVVIAPLLASAGTNIKIMEAMAMGRAVVSTPAGINGLELSPGEDVIVAGDADGMAGEILDLFADPAKRKRIEAAARLRVERDYDWDRIAERQAQLYRNLDQTNSLSD
jgi:GT2 family glycosyltransferase/glycosyltransferase involved in cell wall biosynthesis